jgi:hypothetical protein
VIGKLTQKEDPTGLVTLINYDNLGNPTSVIVDPGHGCEPARVDHDGLHL